MLWLLVSWVCLVVCFVVRLLPILVCVLILGCRFLAILWGGFCCLNVSFCCLFDTVLLYLLYGYFVGWFVCGVCLVVLFVWCLLLLAV